LGGGLLFGRLVDYRGYSFLFTCLAGFVLVAPLVGLLLEDKIVQRQPEQVSIKVKSRFPPVFLILLAAHFLSFTANGAVNLGRSLAMDQMGFSSTAIAGTMAASGIVMIVAPLLIGWLSDRLGRKPFLLFCYFIFALAALMTAWASAYWQFFAALALLALGAVSMNVGAALVSDLIPPERLGAGMSLFQNMFWLGTMVGFAVSGNLLLRMSVQTTFLAWTALPVAAVVLVSFIRPRTPVVDAGSGAEKTQIL
jgi:MFS family permease